MERRRDNKGRVLETGENQRKDGIYQFRYKDGFGRIQYAYAKDLNDLRKKEREIQKELDRGIHYHQGSATVLELVERYVSCKTQVRYNTKVGYNYVLNILKDEPFAQKRIRDIKTSDAQLWVNKLSKDGRGYSTMTTIRGVLRPAFQMAFNEDIIAKNPFDFKLTDVIVNDSEKRIALTEAQKHTWMEFIRTDPTYSRYYDEFIVLLFTGMRVSEFCGLTFKDIDFNEKKINVDHQLVRERGGKYYVEVTKTSCGKRYIPMHDKVYESLKRIIKNRPKLSNEMVVDGYTGFILIDKNMKPKVALHIENEMRWAMHKYNLLHPETPLPHITPHVFRHTFCTDMYNRGMDAKSLQYVMGHSEVRTTMNIYTHGDFERAQKAYDKVFQCGYDVQGEQSSVLQNIG
ncbi:MAG: site-specific integrase [Lachnospiraceae bacterium]|nr:site-specific integrase [Lachnospiraceae bacterium]